MNCAVGLIGNSQANTFENSQHNWTDRTLNTWTNTWTFFFCYENIDYKDVSFVIEKNAPLFLVLLSNLLDEFQPVNTIGLLLLKWMHCTQLLTMLCLSSSSFDVESVNWFMFTGREKTRFKQTLKHSFTSNMLSSTHLFWVIDLHKQITFGPYILLREKENEWKSVNSNADKWITHSSTRSPACRNRVN